MLNQDFRKIAGTPGFNNNEVGADTEIQFCLAKKTPEGENTTGIIRYPFGDNDGWEMEEANTTLKPITQWDPERYINIWVVDYVYADYDGWRIDLAGYAQFPTDTDLEGLDMDGLSFTDGVVINHRCFGSVDIYPEGTYHNTNNRGRTTTHELGHFFGLRHIWGDGDCDVDDFCDDTPVAAEANSGCETGTDTCPDSFGQDMIENYMDYTNDACKNIFTEDQKARITAVMEQAPRRASLKTSDACSPAETYNNDGAIYIQRMNLAECGNSFSPLLTLQNEGTSTMTSAVVSYNIDGGTNHQFPWSGTLTPGQKTNIQLEEMNRNGGTHILNVSLTSVNGIDDENSINGAKLASFRIIPKVVTDEIIVTINTDFSGSDIFWFLTSADGEDFYGFSSDYEDGIEQTYTESVPVDTNKCYMFYIYDFGGNGLCCDNGEGSYTISTPDNVIIAQGSSFGSQDIVRFGVTDVLSTEDFGNSLNSIRLFPNPANETINIAIADKTNIPEKYTIYNAVGQIVDTGNITSAIQTLDVTKYAKGIYFVKLAKGQEATTLQFIKQ